MILSIASTVFLTALVQGNLYVIPEGLDLQRTTGDVAVYRGTDFLVYLGYQHSGFELLDREEGNLEDYFIVLPELLPPGFELSEYGEVLLFDGYVYIMKPGPQSPARACAAARPLRPLYPGPTGGIQFPEPEWDNYVYDMVNSVTQDSMLSLIGRLEQFENRFWSNDSFPPARDWAAAWLEDAGCTVEIQDFPVGSGGISQNIIVTFPGTVYPDKIFLYGAHLDSGNSPYDIFPGADDNASGSSTVMQAARVMAPYEFQYTVKLCLWGAEEAGLVGSYYFAGAAAAAGDSILAVLNTDMIIYGPSIGPIGYDILRLNYNGDSSLALAEYFDGIAEVYVPDLDIGYNYTTSGGSDHVSFWQCGFTAIGENETVYPPWYHTEYDLLANYMDFFPFGTNVAKATVATLASLAVPTGTRLSEDLYTGITANLPAVTASPCPATQSVQVLVTGMNGTAALTLFDLTGRCVLTASTQDSSPVLLDLAGLADGMYILQASSGSTTASVRVLLAR